MKIYFFLMDERERIRALLAEGRLTPDEAQLLFEALDDLESSPPPPPHSRGVLERWVRVEFSAADLEVVGEEGLAMPEVEGKAEVVEERGQIVIRPSSLGFLGLGRIRAGELRLRLPRSWGLEVWGGAGDLDVRGVRWVRGRVRAGDLCFRRIEGLEFQSSAGDLEIEALLRGGTHRLDVSAGDLRIKLLAGTSLRVEGVLGGSLFPNLGLVRVQRSAAEGNLNLPAGFTRLPGGFQGRVGAGEGELKIALKAGDLDLEVEEP